MNQHGFIDENDSDVGIDMANYRENRPWGGFENLLDEDGYKVKKLWVRPGARLSLQSHKKRDEHWVVVKGPATIWIDENIEDVRENENKMIPRGAKHRLENKNDYEIIVIEVQYGDYLGEDDIVRYEDDYQRA
ncbi:MAG: phosphomannose isomerase type II C-terminal cupin domain [Spirochaetota bacterium]|nr:phosphomannose isomerase type II C-terminal cupin domain [Spirochaetota bacterium]